MSILQNSNAISAGGYDINNSLRFRSSASAYLNRTPASAGNRQIWTWSGWVKRGTLATLNPLFNGQGAGTGSAQTLITFTSTDILRVYTDNATSSDLQTTQLFSDPAAWYHIVVAFDTTQATAANRVKIYVNGNQVTAFGTASYPAQNLNTAINLTNQHNIGKPYDAFYFDGYMAEVNFIDGSQKAASDFGETDTTTGVWKPKAYTGTYGTNGFYLKFSDIATTSGSNAGLGKDFSGNSNYWTTNNISVTSGTTYDAMTDSPTLTSATVANYCVMNPNNKTTDSAISQANLYVYPTASTGGNGVAYGTMAITSGKWYFEGYGYQGSSNGNVMIGVADAFTNIQSQFYSSATGWALDNNIDGNFYKRHNGTYASLGSRTNPSIMMVAIDKDAGKIWFGCNGVWLGSGDPVNGTNAAYSDVTISGVVPAVYVYDPRVNSDTINMNFGQRPFAYTPPTGYVALNTYNLPTPTILQGNKYMDATTWTSAGTTQVVVNQGQFKPDLVWNKERSGTSNHFLNDSVRGAANYLNSNTTGAEASLSTYLTSFNSNGFTMGTTQYGSGSTVVGWQWQAGQGSTSSNTSGTITSTVSVNTTAGFSVVTYTSQASSTGTVGHGLGVAPKFIIIKLRGISNNWTVYHASTGATGYLNLNTTGAFATSSGTFANTAPTSSVFTLGTDWAGSYTSVAYCWAEIAGFSKFGSYTGNGSADGPFVATNFTPKYVLIKGTDAASAGNWFIFDTSRDTYNVMPDFLLPNSSQAEATSAGYKIDILSNGFKIRDTGNQINGSGGVIIYAAFAESPFRNSLAR